MCPAGRSGLRGSGHLRSSALCFLQVTEVLPPPACRSQRAPSCPAATVAMSGLSNKRAAGDGGSGPPEKKLNREEKTTTTLIEPIRLGGISSTVGGLWLRSRLASVQSVQNLVCARVCIYTKRGGGRWACRGARLSRGQLCRVVLSFHSMLKCVPISPAVYQKLQSEKDSGRNRMRSTHDQNIFSVCARVFINFTGC